MISMDSIPSTQLVLGAIGLNVVTLLTFTATIFRSWGRFEAKLENLGKTSDERTTTTNTRLSCLEDGLHEVQKEVSRMAGQMERLPRRTED